MSVAELLAQLKAKGLTAEEISPGPSPNFRWVVVKSITIHAGKFAGKDVDFAFGLPADGAIPFPALHIRPRIGHGVAPSVQDSGLGAEWEYWSRKFEDWAYSTRDARAILAHFQRVMANVT